MKRISLLILLFLLIFSSCSKDDSNPYHISFTVDGVNKKFTGHVLAHIDSVGAYTELTILASNSILDMDNYLGIFLNNYPAVKPITAGQYEDNITEFTLLTTYARDLEEFEAGQSVYEDGVNYNVPITHHFKLIITTMNKSTVTGTFSGDYFFQGDVRNGEKLNITNGSFHAKFQ